ncbi:nuclear transport factor 2 family protein [Microbacterium sp. Mu-80]|uniref:Nuclear transport factor 2 family protein n=1 Tax=Microbacterium bandirmense TaxID=3122050 RepID=A0ABU8LA75_9MICO
MTAAELLHGLMSAIDERRWGDLERYLHEGFSCRYVHTGESFDRATWIRLNAEYPGFDRLIVEEIVGEPDAAACRSHVTSRSGDEVNHFECATFVRVRDGLIEQMTEVWTDVDQTAHEGTRPEAGSID